MLHPATYSRLMQAGVLVVAGVVGLCRAEQPTNLLNNPGAEQAQGSGASHWFAARVPAEGLRMWRATDAQNTGQASLAISNEHEYEQKVCNNWVQELADVPGGKTVRLSASVKTADAESVNVCIQCWDQTNRKMLAFGSSPLLRGTRDWTRVESQAVYVPPGTTAITIRAALTGTGSVWFDDFSLTVIETEVTPAPEGTQNLLRNAGAERAADEEPLEWFAARVPADGLRMWRATDERHAGEASLAIWNEHRYAEKVCNNWAQKVWEVPIGQQLQLSGYVKTEGAESVNLCFACLDQNERQQLAFASTPAVKGDQEWTLLRSSTVVVPPQTAAIVVRAVLTGTGKAWFDDLSLEAVASDQAVPIDARLQGLWAGHEQGAEDLVWTALFCGPNMVLVCSSGEGGCGIGRTDTSCEPHHFEATITCACPYAEAVGAKVMGIYAIEDDLLTMCLNAPGDANRPADFGAPGSRTLVLTRRK